MARFVMNFASLPLALVLAAIFMMMAPSANGQSKVAKRFQVKATVELVEQQIEKMKMCSPKDLENGAFIADQLEDMKLKATGDCDGDGKKGEVKLVEIGPKMPPPSKPPHTSKPHTSTTPQSPPFTTPQPQPSTIAPESGKFLPMILLDNQALWVRFQPLPEWANINVSLYTTVEDVNAPAGTTKRNLVFSFHVYMLDDIQYFNYEFKKDPSKPDFTSARQPKKLENAIGKEFVEVKFNLYENPQQKQKIKIVLKDVKSTETTFDTPVEITSAQVCYRQRNTAFYYNKFFPNKFRVDGDFHRETMEYAIIHMNGIFAIGERLKPHNSRIITGRVDDGADQFRVGLLWTDSSIKSTLDACANLSNTNCIVIIGVDTCFISKNNIEDKMCVEKGRSYLYFQQVMEVEVNGNPTNVKQAIPLNDAEDRQTPFKPGSNFTVEIKDLGVSSPDAEGIEFMEFKISLNGIPMVRQRVSHDFTRDNDIFIVQGGIYYVTEGEH